MTETVEVTEHNVVNPVSTDSNGDVVTASDGSPAAHAVIDGLAASQRRLESAGTYNSTDILAVEILVPGNGTLVLSPKDGSTDITVSNAELVAMGISVYLKTWYGRFDSVSVTGTTEAHLYHD